ncbi:MAG: YihY/virulence factor BrkB family protein [Deltaproteobacteria bacterium]|nr:YihY/virulence factor BrkB family protein [Deltaproteobacteria bacterium]
MWIENVHSHHQESPTVARKQTFRALGKMLWDAAKMWLDKKSPRLGASLSYYAVFSIAPTLLVALSIAGLVLGSDAAQGRVLDELKTVLGPDAAQLVQTMLAKSSEQKSGIVGSIVGIVTLILGATAVMVELQAALDILWDTAPRTSGIKALIKERILSLALVLTVGFLLVVSLLVSAAMVAVSNSLGRYMPGMVVLGTILNNVVSFGVLTVFFALVFKYLPNAKVAWKDVWMGGLLTSALFQLGRALIALYIGRAGVSSTFGAAGSLAVLLVWVYYSSQIVLMGAAVTRLWAERFGGGAPRGT